MANSSSRIAGICNLTIDGVPYQLRGKASYMLSSVTRETITGQDAVHGFKEMPKAGQISFDISDSDGLSVTSLNAMTDETVVLVLANGKTITGSKMWTVETQEVDTEEAKLNVKFECRDGGVLEQQ